MSNLPPNATPEHADAPRAQTEGDPVHDTEAHHTVPPGDVGGDTEAQRAENESPQLLEPTEDIINSIGMPVVVHQLAPGEPFHYVDGNGKHVVAAETPITDNQGALPPNMEMAMHYLQGRMHTDPSVINPVGREEGSTLYVTLRPPQMHPNGGVIVMCSTFVGRDLGPFKQEDAERGPDRGSSKTSDRERERE